MTDLLHFPSSAPPDAEARRQALDIHRSFIVEAPAGSGKTGLLIQRLLKLLADPSVEQPEQVLAITFTLKATAEMRDRVLAHLAAATSESVATENEFQSLTYTLAQAVLARDRELGWELLDHPHRLNIRTIDSVCAQIARTLPVLSGSGGRLIPTEDAGPLHREAARRTLLLLGTGDVAFDQALRNLLLHRDGNLADCESLLAEMLRLRDQWGDLIPLTPIQLDDDWLDTHVLPRLELALDHAIQAALRPLTEALPVGFLAELTTLAADLAPAAPYDLETPSPIALCASLHTPPEATASHQDHWLALIHLLISGSGKLRKERGITSRFLKFNYNRKSREHTRLLALINQLHGRDDLLLALKNVRALPTCHYPRNQWAVAKSLFRVLSHALIELQLVFAARNQCDFTEINLLARQALTAESGPDDLAAALGARLQHLLVDEMQDTSSTQYDLIERLTTNWDSYSQTVFLVGDPRQSIYLFRQARVERFVNAMHTEQLGDLPLSRLHLTANFRSQSTLVEQFNHDFALIFPYRADLHALPYTAAQSTLPASPYARATVWHANPIPPATDLDGPAVGTESGARNTDTTLSARVLDAQTIRRIALDWRAKPLPPGRTKPWSIAVLVSARSHLNEIVAALKQDGADGTIPFRAVEIDALSQRQEVLDLTALTRALLHPADRVATLALLRSPCCGLSLSDLHTLTGTDDPSLQDFCIRRLIVSRGPLLPNESRQRIERVRDALESAASQRAHLTTSQLVERTWRSLGMDAYLNQTELSNTFIFFNLLDNLESQLAINSSSDPLDSSRLDEHLKKLFAEPNYVPDNIVFVDILTIHKAKGLEWDVVLVPSLERQSAVDRNRLLTWSELEPTGQSEDLSAHLMLAPIAAKGENIDPLTRWLNGIHRARQAAERKRLFYVASTRARQELHLFATPQITSSGEIRPHPNSLLEAAWPAAGAHFAAMEPRAAETIDLDLAASGTSGKLQRLPLSFDPEVRFAAARTHRLPYGDPDSDTASNQAIFSRPEGSFAARTFGNVVHAALEIFANRIANGHSSAELLAELPSWTPRITALLRADGLAHTIVLRLVRETRAALENMLRDPDGLWLLAPNACAASELALSTWATAQSSDVTRPISIRIDRIFRSGTEPHAPGDDVLWIIDYKTGSHGSSGLDDFLAAQRTTYAPQLETYARALTQLPHPPDRPAPKEVRLALYYPTLPRLLWWTFA